PPTDSTVTLPLARGGLFNKKVTLTSCSGGDMVPSEFFPRLMRWSLDGTLGVDEMVTREIGLDEVEDAFAAMSSGTVIRSVIRLEGRPRRPPMPGCFRAPARGDQN